MMISTVLLRSFLLLAVLLLCPHLSLSEQTKNSSDKKNVLFILVDDLRPQLGAYGQSFMHTPHIDNLAASGLRFNRAYTQYSYCAPSRNSFMTGRRPDRTQDYNFIDDFRESSIGADWISMPEYFKTNDYLVLGAGKTYQPGLPAAYDTPKSWSEDYLYVAPSQCDETSRSSKYVNCSKGVSACEDKKAIVHKGSNWCSYDETKLAEPLFDRVSAKATTRHLQVAAAQEKNFFVAVGFHRPHLPWACPQQFYDLYPSAADMAPPKHPYVPDGMPLVSWHNGLDHNDIAKPVPATVAQKMRRAYYACVSYTDSLVGEVLAELERLQLTNNTVVVLTSDHGWQLGEHNLWKKMTNFELGTRVPFIIRDPSIPSSHGKTTQSFAELVDLYKTMADLAGLPAPDSSKVQGRSLKPSLLAPDDPGHKYAFSQFAKANNRHGKPWDTCMHCHRDQINYMGLAIRSDNYRLVQWYAWDKQKARVDFDRLHAEELYSHESDDGTDFDLYENENLANSSALQPAKEALEAHLLQHFQNDWVD